MARQTAAGERRKDIRDEFFREVEVWTGENEKGWFRIPRTLPLILQLLGNKKLSGSIDPTSVYLELLSRHMDNGIIEMGNESLHAYSAGYVGTRAVRTWQERMKKLEELGFIKTKKIGNQQFRFVALIHPTVAVQNLADLGQIDEDWLNTFRARQLEVKDETFEKRKARKEAEAKSSESDIPF